MSPVNPQLIHNEIESISRQLVAIVGRLDQLRRDISATSEVPEATAFDLVSLAHHVGCAVEFVYKGEDGILTTRLVLPTSVEPGLFRGLDHARQAIRSFRYDRMQSAPELARWEHDERTT
jgi:predicted DNA-binding transcriptional regulator YafY